MLESIKNFLQSCKISIVDVNRNNEITIDSVSPLDPVRLPTKEDNSISALESSPYGDSPFSFAPMKTEGELENSPSRSMLAYSSFSFAPERTREITS